MMLHRLTTIFLLLSSLVTGSKPKAEMPECFFQGVDLMPCLSTSVTAAANTSEACCRAVDRAIRVGHSCLCSLLLASGALLLGSISPLSTPLEAALPGCSLSSLSPIACQDPLQLTSPPVENNGTAHAPPMAATPAPKPALGDQMEPNMTHSGPQMVREGPKDKDTVTVLSTGGVKYGDSCGGQREKVDWSYKIFIWVIMPVSAWLLY